MPTYTYYCKSLSGEPSSGVLEAKNEHELARVLRQQGFILISAQSDQDEAPKKKMSFALPSLRRNISLPEKIFFTRNLKVMIAAGIPLPRSLKILSAQTKNSNFRKSLLEVAEEITKGRGFSDSLAKHPKAFSELFVSMVKVGEEGGTLEDVLSVLTRQMERDHELSSKIKGALIYPAVIVCAMVLIGIAMLILVVPKLAETFADLGVPLPLTTRLVIGMGQFMANYWYLLPLIIIAVVVLLRMAAATKSGKKAIDTAVLRLPIISSLIKKANAAATARTLSSLISSGVPIVRALEVVSNTLGNVYYKKAMRDASEQVRKGSKLGEVLKKYGNIYPSLVIQMVEIGEETGETSSILEKLADFFESEVTEATKNISSIIEPILMLFIGGAVGFFAISMFQPIYSMIQAMQ